MADLRENARAALAIVVVVLSAACGGLGGSSGPSAPTPVVPPGLSGRLAFIWDGGLWTLDLVSARWEQVRRPPGNGYIQWARWSPDGARLAYSTFEFRDGRTAVAEVWVMVGDGASPPDLIGGHPEGFFQIPAWAPDGGSLYVLFTPEGANERARRLERIEIATGARQRISEVDSLAIRAFDVSPDGRWLAATVSVSEGTQLVLVALDDGAQRILVREGQFAEVDAPRFDPASGSVLFAASSETTGTNSIRIGPLAPRPAYAHGTPRALYRVPTSGSTPTRLTDGEFDEPIAAWSPDGAQISLLSSEMLAVLRVGAGAPTPILQPGAHGSVDWTR
jgi:Tol biopolymer transport system component